MERHSSRLRAIEGCCGGGNDKVIKTNEKQEEKACYYCNSDNIDMFLS